MALPTLKQIDRVWVASLFYFPVVFLMIGFISLFDNEALMDLAFDALVFGFGIAVFLFIAGWPVTRLLINFRSATSTPILWMSGILIILANAAWLIYCLYERATCKVILPVNETGPGSTIVMCLEGQQVVAGFVGFTLMAILAAISLSSIKRRFL